MEARGVLLDPHIRDMIVEAIEAAEASVCTTQCYYSDVALTLALVQAMRDRQVSVGFIADRGQCRNAWMSEQLRVLLEWKADIRTFSPPGSAAALMHAKSWLADDCLAVLANSNGTKNSMNDCYEMMVSTPSLKVTTKSRRAFDLWAISAQLVVDMLPDPKMARRS